MMKKLFESRAFLVIGVVCQIYVGLGWLGIVGGFVNTTSIFSKAGGALFLLTGIVSSGQLFKRK